MSAVRLLFVAACGTTLAGATVQAETPAISPDERTVVARIDALIATRCAEADLEPSERATDAEFLRRAFLDLVGTIPTAGEARDFLADPSADKRERLIATLLERPDHATHLATLWREDLLATVENRELLPADSLRLLDHWLRIRFLENDGYHTLAAGLLTATGDAASDRGAAVYLTAHRGATEPLAAMAAGTSRMFLGVQIDCAQCHDHPFTTWSQADFWNYAAVFSQVEARRDSAGGLLSQVTDGPARPVMILDTNVAAEARLLGSDVDVTNVPSRRTALAEWLVAPENPFFASTAVNRLWATLFGYGIVHPMDDFGDHNPASHPEILELLADDFRSHGYDVRRTLRILANTQAYQRTSRGESAVDPRLFARKAVRPLTPRQLHASLRTAAGLLPAPESDPEAAQFVARFDTATSRVEYQAGIPQALLMMNGEIVASLTDPQESRLISAIAESPFFTDEERIETLFLATLTRPPTPEEAVRCLDYLKESQSIREGLSDVLWALLNGSEFALNH